MIEVVAAALVMLCRSEDDSRWGVRLDDPNTATCGVAEYFDTIRLGCEVCALGVGDAQYVDNSGRALRCRCDIGSVKHCIDDECVCLQCDETSLQDSSECASCGPTTTLSTTGNPGRTDCGCSSSTQRLVERNATGALLDGGKVCAACPARSRRVDAYTCEPCASRHMAGSSDCACVSPYTTVGLPAFGDQFCVPETQLADVVSEYPIPRRSRYERVQRRPKGGDDGTAVLEDPLLFEHLYPWAATKCAYHDGTLESDQACQCLANLCAITGYDDQESPCQLLDRVASSSSDSRAPALYWTGDTEWVVPTKMTLKTKLKFVLARYSLNGTLLGFEPLTTQAFWGRRRAPFTQRGGGSSRSTKWLRFATSFHNTFEVRLDELLDPAPYRQGDYTSFYDLYLVVANGDASRWFPVPVRVEVRQQALAYVRRFFFVDTLSGVVDGTRPSILRYAASISLIVEAQRDGPKHKIRVPRLKIRYRERTRTSVLDSRRMRLDSVDLEVTYSAQPNKRILWGFLFAGASITVALAALGATRSVPKFFSSQGPVALCEAFVLVFFTLTFAVATYYLVYFKLQDKKGPANLLLPDENDVSSLVLLSVVPMIAALWAAQTAVVCALIRRQATLDISLIDWEKSDRVVSEWRSILVANELADIQISRRTSLAFTLTWLTYFLVGLGYENNATPQPDLQDRGDFGANSPLLQFANTGWWFLIFSAIQLFFNGAIKHTMLVDPPQARFIDLCALAKISLFSVVDGFYVHGDASHSADTADLASLASTQVIDKWEGSSSREFHVGELTDPFRRAFHAVDRENASGKPAFLKTFLNHGFADKYNVDFAVVTESNPPPSARDSTFIPDATTRPWPFNLARPRWLRGISFLGHESTLLVHELLTLCFVQLVVTNTNTPAALFTTYACHILLGQVRHFTGKSNLAKQILVDERFIIS
ncbi:hypothetical protein CTAYLR_002190 [Chrysophaeum taylorii]|uniref:Meckelin n=1 Tax=Chrysophaeum taylorii TaxID=2483200 RepID=A0AAD7UPW9_9STRA|nr:hypothetical protein CTAYLR_002190 [Chrysophaeum taylorii]